MNDSTKAEHVSPILMFSKETNERNLVMTEQGKLIMESIRRNLAALAELECVAPADVDQIVVAMTAHLRSWRPLSLSSLGTSPAVKATP